MGFRGQFRSFLAFSCSHGVAEASMQQRNLRQWAKRRVPGVSRLVTWVPEVSLGLSLLFLARMGSFMPRGSKGTQNSRRNNAFRGPWDSPEPWLQGALYMH